MGASRRRRSDRAGRGPIRSPGRPTAGRREHRQAFWKAIARGMSSWDAALEAGVSQPVGTRWFRENGGMPPTNLTPLSGRYLSFAEREEIALLRAQKCGVCEIARRLERSSSTISRELRRKPRRTPSLSRDATGKVHGQLPSIEDLKRVPTDNVTVQDASAPGGGSLAFCTFWLPPSIGPDPIRWTN
jgi:Helix-turn-helix domain